MIVRYKAWGPRRAGSQSQTAEILGPDHNFLSMTGPLIMACQNLPCPSRASSNTLFHATIPEFPKSEVIPLLLDSHGISHEGPTLSLPHHLYRCAQLLSPAP